MTYFLPNSILYARPTFQLGYKKSTPNAEFQIHFFTEISGKKNGKEVKNGSYIVGLESGSPTRSYGKSGRKTVSKIVEIIK